MIAISSAMRARDSDGIADTTATIIERMSRCCPSDWRMRLSRVSSSSFTSVSGVDGGLALPSYRQTGKQHGDELARSAVQRGDVN